jgi:methyltransferase-like protein
MIMAVSSTRLAPQGIAYVSYNTYPGWHMREMIRDMMIYHTAQFTDSRQKIQQARALIDFLSRSVPTQDNHYGLLLKSELELIKQSKDYYLFHDHLERENSPLYFHQFIERAERCGLQYLGEAEFSTMLASGFSKEVAETLLKISPHITQTEQYMDFLRNRLFRQTILCHREVTLNRNLGPADSEGLYFASNAAGESKLVDFTAGKKQTFRTRRGATLETSSPLTKAAFVTLGECWPRAMDIDSLLEQAARRLGVAECVPQERRALQADLLQCYSANVVEFHAWQADFPIMAGSRPRLYPLAAYQLKEGLPIVNQRHEPVGLDVVASQIGPFLDGSRDRAALHESMEQQVTGGSLVIRQDNQPVSSPEMIRQYLEKALEQTLSNLASAALLA